MVPPATVAQPSKIAPTLQEIVQLPFADITVDSEWADLDPAAMVYSTAGNGWNVGDYPAELNGAKFTRFPMHHKVEEGKTTFTVTSPGVVLLGCTPNWGKGGSGGAWKGECMTKDALEQQGWRSMGRARNWKLFYRQCVEGESFAVRTEKYNPPVLFRFAK